MENNEKENSSQDNVILELDVSERGKLDSVKTKLKERKDKNKTELKNKNKMAKRDVAEISLLSQPDSPVAMDNFSN